MNFFDHVEFARSYDIIRTLTNQAAQSDEVKTLTDWLVWQAAGALIKELEARLPAWQAALDEAQAAVEKADKQHAVARATLQAVKQPPQRPPAVEEKSNARMQRAGGPYDPQPPPRPRLVDGSKERREREVRIDHAAAEEDKAAIAVRFADTALRKAGEKVAAAEKLIDTLGELPRPVILELTSTLAE